MAQEILSPYDTTVGDIFVKIATILQGKGELEAAIDHLVKAKKLYEKSSSMISDNDRKKKVLLGQKLVEVLTGIANLYVDSEELEKASSSYKVSGVIAIEVESSWIAKSQTIIFLSFIESDKCL